MPLDRWLERIVREVYRLDDVEVGLKARWRRWCGLAVFFTTVVLDAEVLSKAPEASSYGKRQANSST